MYLRGVPAAAEDASVFAEDGGTYSDGACRARTNVLTYLLTDFDAIRNMFETLYFVMRCIER